MQRKRLARVAAFAVGAAIATASLAGTATAKSDDSLLNQLGFIPLDDAPQTCQQAGIEWSPSVVPTQVMHAGDAATPGPNALPAQVTVPGENDMIAFDPSGRFLFTVSETGSNGAVTKLDLTTGTKTILAQRTDWNRLDPIKWYEPSGMLLIGEEDGLNGSMWQVDPDSGASTELLWLGKMSHEGVGFAADGSIWMGDENHLGAIFRAVPNAPEDLTAGGTLSFLVDGVGFSPVTSPQTAVADAFAGGATLYDRPEDFDQADGRIYFSVTEPLDTAQASSILAGRPVHEGGVYSVNDSGVPHVTLFAALNDPTTPGTVTGLQYPDNLAIDRKGNVWIHEDIPDGAGVHTKQSRNMQDELWVALADKNGDGMNDGMYKFANMGNSATAGPCQNEWTGGAFHDDSTFFVNQQHADSPTWKVELQRGGALHNPKH